MSEPFLQTMEKGTKCLIEGSMLEWIYYVRLKTLPDDYFPRHSLVRGTSDSLRNSLVALLYSPELVVRDVITGLGSLIMMGMTIT